MNVILFDDKDIHQNLLPLTFTRPIADIRFGIFTIRQKWENLFPADYSYLTEPYLSVKYPVVRKTESIFIGGHLSPDDRFVSFIPQAERGCLYTLKERPALFVGEYDAFCHRQFMQVKELPFEPLSIGMLYDIFTQNKLALEQDFRYILSHRRSAELSDSNRVIGERYYEDGTSRIFIEEGAKAECAVFNLTKGPIYIGKGAEIMEGSLIRGPFAACDHAVVKMGAKIYGATTIGPYCKVGGELNNVVMFGYSNKAHDGFLGDAVIGEWCNIGGGTTASNLKNDYSEIKLWNYSAARFLRTGLQFCGLIMGDHAKAGVNCMFNTATVLGVGVNIHGAGFPRNFVPSFSEGGTSSGFTDVALSKFYTIANRMMSRRGLSLTDEDKAIFEAIYNQAENYK